MFSKLVGKVNLKFEEMPLLWRAKRYKVYSGKSIFWHYYLQLSFVYKTMSQISFKLFCSEDKRFLAEFLRKWGWFQGHNERFPWNIIWKAIQINSFCWDYNIITNQTKQINWIQMLLYFDFHQSHLRRAWCYINNIYSKLN